MKKHDGRAISWEMTDGVVELALHREPLNEIGSLTLEELEKFIEELETATAHASTLIVYSKLPGGFSAGADLRELYTRGREMREPEILGLVAFLKELDAVR